MAGKPGYDEKTVIAQAVKTFWTLGYAGTSVADLVTATGLSRSSLYQRFIDKDGLFLEALAAYHARVIARMSAVAAENPASPIEAILRDFAPGAGGPERPSGCLVARTCIESPSLPIALKKAAMRCLAEQQDIFVKNLAVHLKTTKKPANIDLQDLGWYFLGVFHAVLNFPLAGAGEANINGLIRASLMAIKAN